MGVRPHASVAGGRQCRRFDHERQCGDGTRRARSPAKQLSTTSAERLPLSFITVTSLDTTVEHVVSVESVSTVEALFRRGELVRDPFKLVLRETLARNRRFLASAQNAVTTGHEPISRAYRAPQAPLKPKCKELRQNLETVTQCRILLIRRDNIPRLIPRIFSSPNNSSPIASNAA